MNLGNSSRTLFLLSSLLVGAIGCNGGEESSEDGPVIEAPPIEFDKPTDQAEVNGPPVDSENEVSQDDAESSGTNDVDADSNPATIPLEPPQNE